MKPKAVVLLSGGLDSATAAAQAIADGYDLIALSLRYAATRSRNFSGAARSNPLGYSKPHYLTCFPFFYR